ncbi:MAG: tRNA (guanosine(46)-N7)-methyltransferase TrmB [Muribaculaceae bacterium]|nr:tRNA (guanosine(46)-N7)-methyltransferase TrmB [Muribaculaceae bacterium]
MGKNKLKKFADMETYASVFQYPWARLQKEEFPLRGKWHKEYFHNENPIVLELGCGKGEYTVGLAERYNDKNYIGVDIKGARIWSGATDAEKRGMMNVAFIRTEIESIQKFFAPGEVSEIWITFPDPQMHKVRKRLTSSRFLMLYREILRGDGMIHLKTDSPFLYEFTSRLVKENALPVLRDSDDLYGSGMADSVTSIKTYYEQQWLSRGKKIKLISFTLPSEGNLSDPEEEDIERDDYRSYPRGISQCMPEELAKLREEETR